MTLAEELAEKVAIAVLNSPSAVSTNEWTLPVPHERCWPGTDCISFHCAAAINEALERAALECEKEVDEYKRSATITVGISNFADINGAVACRRCAEAIHALKGKP